jgi:hypothetical protein
MGKWYLEKKSGTLKYSKYVKIKQLKFIGTIK